MTDGDGAGATASAPHTEGRWARWAGHPAAPALLFVFAVVEGCLFPAPTEALYAALALARPRRAWALAAVAAAGSVAGGVVAWTLGRYFEETLARRSLAQPSWGHAASVLAGEYRENAALALITSGYTPIPYLLYGLTAGAAGMPLGTFVLFSAIGRGLKYAVLAAVARAAGPALRRWMDRSLLAVIAVVTVVAALAVMAMM
jgi:membrane protein YqaA with SNARE-associated domain